MSDERGTCHPPAMEASPAHVISPAHYITNPSGSVSKFSEISLDTSLFSIESGWESY